MLALKPTELQELQRILSHTVPKATVLAYGSRVQHSSAAPRIKPFSDLDLVFKDAVLLPNEMFLLRDALAQSNLPFRVDICHWQDLPAAWKPQLKTERIQ